jgi:hypothetical protein
VVRDNPNAVWRRRNDDTDDTPNEGGDVAVVDRGAAQMHSSASAEISPAQATTSSANDFEPGSPMPRSWLIALAGAVMGGILSIGLYSQAVGSSSSGNSFAFGGPGGGQRGPQPQFQGAPNQGGVQPNQGVAPQRNQNGQLIPGGQGQAQANGGIGGANQGQAAIGALPRAPDFSGSIRNISGTSATVDSPQGTRVVEVDSGTQVFRSDGSSGSASDLTRGSVVAVVASTDPNTRLLRAEAIAILR